MRIISGHTHARTHTRPPMKASLPPRCLTLWLLCHVVRVGAVVAVW
jgi:hypothetical protein